MKIIIFNFFYYYSARTRDISLGIKTPKRANPKLELGCSQMQSQNYSKRGLFKEVDPSWDFRGSDTKYSNHGFHTYPAMMIPQIARRLIESYGKDAKVLLDPFMGSGTAVLEATLHENFTTAYGIDINPLAILISKVKTNPIKSEILSNEYKKLLSKCVEGLNEIRLENKEIETPDFFNIDFWFKSYVIKELTVIKNSIELIEDQKIKNFFYVAFSETVRNVSNTRNSEYKLYRMNQEMLSKHKPDVLVNFKTKAKSNIEKMGKYVIESNKNCNVKILSEDSRHKTSIPDQAVDLIVTSPPYGDSRSTVAYGQFSRLALQWIGYEKEEVMGIDKESLGGIPSKDLIVTIDSPSLKETIEKISAIDAERARDVLSFYLDFDMCVKELHRVTKEGAFLCFVVGNRTVKGIQIPTDDIIVEMFQLENNYKHHRTIIREIPTKRMPRINSPSNIKGDYGKTMNQEWIIILEKT